MSNIVSKYDMEGMIAVAIEVNDGGELELEILTAVSDDGVNYCVLFILANSFPLQVILRSLANVIHTLMCTVGHGYIFPACMLRIPQVKFNTHNKYVSF